MHDEQNLEKIMQEIGQVETWLRDHPNAEWQSRYDMIQKLAQLNEQLDQAQTFDGMGRASSTSVNQK